MKVLTDASLNLKKGILKTVIVSFGQLHRMAEKHNSEYVKLNRNILLGFIASVTISAAAAQAMSGQAHYLNSSATLAVDLMVYYALFSGLFYLDNRKKYLLPSGEIDKSRLRSDLAKMVTSLGIGELVYSICRWFVQYYLLTGNVEAYISSVLAQSISFVAYLVCVNMVARSVRLYKKD